MLFGSKTLLDGYGLIDQIIDDMYFVVERTVFVQEGADVLAEKELDESGVGVGVVLKKSKYLWTVLEGISHGLEDG
jgi:hypothetical protein